MKLLEMSVEMGHLPAPECFIFAAAQGWFDLGAFSDAERELKQLSEVTREDLDVLLFQTKLLLALGQFEEAKEAAFKVLKDAPEEIDAWLCVAESVYRLEGAEAGIRCLKKLERLLSENHRYCIAVARYYAVLGESENAKEWLGNSLIHGDALKEAERFDELHPYISNLAEKLKT